MERDKDLRLRIVAARERAERAERERGTTERERAERAEARRRSGSGLRARSEDRGLEAMKIQMERMSKK